MLFNLLQRTTRVLFLGVCLLPILTKAAADTASGKWTFTPKYCSECEGTGWVYPQGWANKIQCERCGGSGNGRSRYEFGSLRIQMRKDKLGCISSTYNTYRVMPGGVCLKYGEPVFQFLVPGEGWRFRWRFKGFKRSEQRRGPRKQLSKHHNI